MAHTTPPTLAKLSKRWLLLVTATTQTAGRNQMATSTIAAEQATTTHGKGHLGRRHQRTNGEWLTITTGEGDHQRTTDFLLINDGRLARICAECDGIGTLATYLHVHDGVCFPCQGSGVASVTPDLKTALSRERANYRRAVTTARRRAAKADEAAAAARQWRTANPELAARLDAIVQATNGSDPHHIPADLHSLAHRAERTPLSAKQAAYAQRLLDEHDAKQARRATLRHAGEIGAPATVTGTVAVAITVDGMYGERRMLIVEGAGEYDGITVKVFSTSAAAYSAERGDTLTVSGTVKRHTEYQGVPQTELARPKLATATR